MKKKAVGSSSASITKDLFLTQSTQRTQRETHNTGTVTIERSRVGKKPILMAFAETGLLLEVKVFENRVINQVQLINFLKSVVSNRKVKKMLVDNMMHWDSTVDSFCKGKGIERLRTNPGHPMAKGFIEKNVRQIEAKGI